MLPEEYDPGRKLPYHLRPKRVPKATGETMIRPATAHDLPAVAAIFKHYVENAAMALVSKPFSLEHWRRTFNECRELNLPFLVAETGGGEILGFAYVRPWAEHGRARRKYVENSIYLRPAAHGFGLGTRLMHALLDAATDSGVRSVIAVIADSGADASIALHKALGYKIQSRMGGIQRKFGKSYGTILMEKKLSRRRR